MKCDHCGSEEILSDYFEDEWQYWCGTCGREVRDDALNGDEYSDVIPDTEGTGKEHKIPSVDGTKD